MPHEHHISTTMAAIRTRHTNKGQTSQKVITAAPGYLLRAVASRRTDDNGEVAQTDRQTTIGLHSGWLFWKSRLFFLFSYGAIFCLACVNLFKCVKRWRRRPPLAFCCYCIFKLSSMDSGMTLAKGYYGGYIRRVIECWVLAAVWAREEGGSKDYEKYIINILIKMHNKLRQAPK